VLALDEVSIPSSSAAPFALVVNELLGNALKHAFPAGRAGRVTVSLADQGSALMLTVEDDGVGMAGPPDGFGSTILKLLCQQLHAELRSTQVHPGTQVTVRVPLSRAPASP
jgi:two-component sensor histidine kinase